METMHYSERKKSSKGAVIGLLVFFIIGGAILYLGIKTEEEPTIIGQEESDIQRLVNIEKQENVETANINSTITYSIEDVKYSDSSDSVVKSDITLPNITVDSVELGEINVDIDKEYTELYEKFKEQLKTAESKYTYIVSYDTYENMVGTEKVVSIVITQKMRDDLTKKYTMQYKKTYNIALSKKELLTETEIAQELLGKEYKTIIRSQVKDYVVGEGMLKSSDFTYAYTGLEDFYVKDNIFHIIFNEDKLVDKEYGVLDIEINEEE